MLVSIVTTAVVALAVLAASARPARLAWMARSNWIGVLLLVGIVLGQAVGGHKAGYPFVEWSMYSSQSNEASYREHLIVTREGTTRPFPYHALVFTAGWPLQAALDHAQEKCTCARADAHTDGLILALTSAAAVRKLGIAEFLIVEVGRDHHNGKPPATVVYRWRAGE